MKIQTGSLWLALGLGLSTATAVLMVTGCAGDRYDRSTGEYIDDKSVIMRVKDALNHNPDYKYNSVEVVSFKGNVQLNGFVDNSWLKANATSIALKVAGVKNVDNNLSVKNGGSNGEQSADKTLSARVNSALIDNTEYKFEEVHVSAFNGTVQLSGFVNTEDQKSRADVIARQIEGVKDVVNQITVKDKI